MSTPPQGEYSGPEVEAAIRILREDAILAGQRAIAERMDNMEKRVSRMPVVEMTAEEKAAEYDRLMAAKNKPEPPAEPPKPDGTPVPPPAKPTEPPQPKRDPWFGEIE